MCYNEKPTDRLIRLVFVGINKRCIVAFQKCGLSEYITSCGLYSCDCYFNAYLPALQVVLHETKTALHDFG